MPWLMHILWDYLKSLVISVPLFLAANTILLLLAQTNMGIFAATDRVRRFAAKVRPGTSFTVEDGGLDVVYYRAETDEEKVASLMYLHKFIYSYMLLRNQRLSGNALRQRATIDIVIRLCLFVIMTVPLIGFGVWLAVSIDKQWWYALVIVLVAQLIQLNTGVVVYFKRLDVFLGFSAIVFFHHYGWNPFGFTFNTQLAIGFGWVMLMLIFTWIFGRSEKRELVHELTADN